MKTELLVLTWVPAVDYARCSCGTWGRLYHALEQPDLNAPALCGQCVLKADDEVLERRRKKGYVCNYCRTNKEIRPVPLHDESGSVVFACPKCIARQKTIYKFSLNPCTECGNKFFYLVTDDEMSEDGKKIGLMDCLVCDNRIRVEVVRELKQPRKPVWANLLKGIR